jgi:hypothetical protein
MLKNKGSWKRWKNRNEFKASRLRRSRGYD